MRILHIHTDYKFLHLMDYYNNSTLINKSLYIGKYQIEYNVDYKQNSNLKGLKLSIKIANEYDIIVMYDLDSYKMYIANRLNLNVLIIWRFFGYELYGRTKMQVYSPMTLKFTKNKRLTLKDVFRKLFYNYSFKFKCFPKREFIKALKRIDYFQCLSYEEYEFLSKEFPLPKFLQSPYPTVKSKSSRNKEGNKILIGNNKSRYNNHIDIINMTKEFPYYRKYLFLSYGEHNEKYINEIMRLADENINFVTIIDFLSKKEFEDLYRDLDAFVLNGYRQMAVANILTAFKYGVKVYMNSKNAYYHFLKNQNFLVYTINDLQKDLNSNNISLSKEQINHNHMALKQLSKTFSKENFIKEVKNLTLK